MKYTEFIDMSLKVMCAICIFIGFGSTHSQAQNWDRLNLDFRRDGMILINSGINGMVAPQFSNYDFNGDGNEDVFVFDRQSGVVMPFVWDVSGEEGRLIYEPSYALNFPKLDRFALLRDYDNDGDRDIFTYPVKNPASSIIVYKNHGTDAEPDFRQLTFPSQNLDILSYAVNGGKSEIYVSNIDLPAIEDVDGDGDLDVLSFEQNSGSYLHYFRNMQVERGLHPDEFDYVFEDFCWGKFIESGLNANISLSDDANSCALGLSGNGKGGSKRHAGSSITLFDKDGDGDMDALIGDLASNNMVMLTNGGDSENSWMTEMDIMYPEEDTPIDITVFLSSFYVDVDNDGVKELIVTPNSSNFANNINHVWLFENTNTQGGFTPNLVTKEFLFNTSLRIPESSTPVFTDVDADGLIDLVVGVYGYSANATVDSRLFYFRNTGTATDPLFEFITDELITFPTNDINDSLHPEFGDVDNDGDEDLIVGDSGGKLNYYENIAGPGVEMVFDSPIVNYMDIDVGQGAKPQLIDYNGDGLLDLIVGEVNDNINGSGRQGGVNYFPNKGTSTVPFFDTDPEDNAFGGIYTRTITVTSGQSDPSIVPTADGSDFIALVGSSFGSLYYYSDFLTSVDTAVLVSDSIPVPRLGLSTSPDLTDIDNDNYYELAIGNLNGGLSFFNTPLQVSMESNATETAVLDEVKLFPNPATHYVTITMPDRQATKYNVTDVNGKLVATGEFTDKEYVLDTSDMITGTYFLKLNGHYTTTTHRIVVVQ